MSQITKAMHLTYTSLYQGLQTNKLYTNMTKKYELKISDYDHFEFYYLWENGVTYSLAYGRNGFPLGQPVPDINGDDFATFTQLKVVLHDYYELTTKSPLNVYQMSQHEPVLYR